MNLEVGTRRRRGKALEEAILEAGWQQLAEAGYGAFTVDAVAERAGTSRSVIYRRWPDRDALVQAVLVHLLHRDRVQAPDTGNLRDDMLELLRRSSATRSSLVPLLSVFISAYFQESGRTLADVRRIAFGGQQRGALDDILDRAVARGEIDPVRLTPRVRTVAFDLFRHELMMTLKPVPEQELVAIVDEIFLPLVRPAGQVPTEAAGADPFAGMTRVVFAHAHPDDETLATGALIQQLTEAGIAVAVVTATRGERGEVVPGPLSHLAGTPELDRHRQGELAAALRALGAEGPFFLGERPARASGLPPRRYTDSGMQWVTPTLAGPGEDAGPDAFTSASVAEASADLAAFVTEWGAELIVSYDIDGGYGHPDHVHAHHVSAAAAAATGIRFAEVISIPRDGTPPDSDGVTWYDRSDHLDELLPALHAHASQFTVDGRDAIHSGGQREPLQLRTGVRRVR